MKKRFAAAAVVLAALAVPAVAGAAPTSWSSGIWVGEENCSTGTCTYWDLSDDGGIGHSYVYVDGLQFGNVICGTEGELNLDGNSLTSNGDMMIDTDANGDKVVTGTGYFVTGLDATVEYRAYAEGDLLRMVYVVTNNTGSAVTVNPSVYEDPSDSYPDNETAGYGASTTTDGDDQVETTDRWYVMYEPTEPAGIYGRFWGSQDDISISGVNSFDITASQNSDDVDFGSVTIPAGGSYQWIFFHKYLSWGYDAAATNDANRDAQAAVAATADDEFGASLALTGRLSRNLDGTILNNWGYSGEPETLPTTGSDSTGLVLAGLTLAIMGGAVLVRRRATV